jgi:hypothetical protein
MMAGISREERVRRARAEAGSLLAGQTARETTGEIRMNSAREDRQGEVRQERRRRKDLSTNAHLLFSIPDHLRDDERYRYHWFVDRPGRIEQKTVHDDWDLVTEPELAADGRQTGAGTRIERHAGVDKYGNPERAFLARKLREHDEEDKRAGQARIDERMRQIKRGKATEDDDGATPGRDGSYVPKGRIVIQENYTP